MSKEKAEKRKINVKRKERRQEKGENGEVEPYVNLSPKDALVPNFCCTHIDCYSEFDISEFLEMDGFLANNFLLNLECQFR